MVCVVKGAFSPRPQKIPQIYILSGPLLLGSAFVPLLPDGRSFWRWSVDLVAEVGWNALAWIMGASSPFVLGLCMILAGVGAYQKQPALCELAQKALAAVVCLWISHCIMLSAQLWWRDIGIASGEFCLVSVVVGLALAMGIGQRKAAAAPAQDEETLEDESRLFARWGCLLIAAASAWARLQIVGGVTFSWGVEVLLVGSTLTVWALCTPAPPQTGAKQSEPRQGPKDPTTT